MCPHLELMLPRVLEYAVTMKMIRITSYKAASIKEEKAIDDKPLLLSGGITDLSRVCRTQYHALYYVPHSSLYRASAR